MIFWGIGLEMAASSFTNSNAFERSPLFPVILKYSNKIHNSITFLSFQNKLDSTIVLWLLEKSSVLFKVLNPCDFWMPIVFILIIESQRTQITASLHMNTLTLLLDILNALYYFSNVFIIIFVLYTTSKMLHPKFSSLLKTFDCNAVN